MKRIFFKYYLKLLRAIWQAIPVSCRGLSPVRAYAWHVDRVVRKHARRSQYFATFFLRNRPELKLLQNMVEQLAPAARLNMTILACSKGAEVYSMVWTIRSVRPDLDLRVNAIDISPEILEFASRGVYSMERVIDRKISSEDAVRQKKGVETIPSSDRYAWIFERMSKEEIESIFEISDGYATVKPWLREGIHWQFGDAFSPELPNTLGPQDIVVANRFLCHMAPPDAERCLRNIGALVKPGGHLFVYGLDLDVRTKIAIEGRWQPVTQMTREIHNGDSSLLSGWPVDYWSLEPFDDTRKDWQLRYASVFQIGEKMLPPLQREVSSCKT